MLMEPYKVSKWQILLELFYAIRFMCFLFFASALTLLVGLLLALLCPIAAILLLFIHTKGEKRVRK